MNILKDSAILSLKDFNRIKNNMYIPSLTSNMPVSKSTLSPEMTEGIDYNKALDHKKRLIEYDKKKREYD